MRLRDTAGGVERAPPSDRREREPPAVVRRAGRRRATDRERQTEGEEGRGAWRSAGRQGRAERVRSGRAATPEGATPLPNEHAEHPRPGVPEPRDESEVARKARYK